MRFANRKIYPGMACAFLCALGTFVSPAAYSAPPAKDAAKKAGSKAQATVAVPAAHVEIPLSVFVMPTEPKQGKDPFFPTSVRPYVSLQPKNAKPAVIDVSLTLNGITPGKLVMVNGRSFSEGEEGEVVVNGVRKKLRCIKIKDESAIVELLPEGERRELKMRFSAN